MQLIINQVLLSQVFPLLLLAFALPLSKLFTSIGIILITFIWLISGNWKLKSRLLFSNWNVWLLAFLFLLNFLSLTYSKDLTYGTSQIVKYLSLIIFPLILGSSGFLTQEVKDRVLRVFVFACFCATLICLGYAIYRNFTIAEPRTLAYSFQVNFGVKGALSFLYWDYFSYQELCSILKIHPAYFSLFIVLVIFYLIDQLKKNWNFNLRSWAKFALVILITYFVFFLLLLSVRIIIFSFLFLLFLYLFWASYQVFGRLKSFVITSSIVLLTFLLIFSLPITRYRLFTETNLIKYEIPKPTDNIDTGLKMRFVHWYSSFKVIKENFLIGTGVGDFQHALDESYEKLGYQKFIGLNAHNQFIQTTLSLGLVGLFSIIALFFISLKKAFQQSDPVYICFIISFIIGCLTESFLQSQKGIVFFAFFNCLFFFYQPNQNSTKKVG